MIFIEDVFRRRANGNKVLKPIRFSIYLISDFLSKILGNLTIFLFLKIT